MVGFGRGGLESAPVARDIGVPGNQTIKNNTHEKEDTQDQTKFQEKGNIMGPLVPRCDLRCVVAHDADSLEGWSVKMPQWAFYSIGLPMFQN